MMMMMMMIMMIFKLFPKGYKAMSSFFKYAVVSGSCTWIHGVASQVLFHIGRDNGRGLDAVFFDRLESFMK